MYVLGFLWALPLTLLTWLVIVPLWFARQFEFVVWRKDCTITWDIDNRSWLGRKLFGGRGWGGFSAATNRIVLDSTEQKGVTPRVARCEDGGLAGPGRDRYRWTRTDRHEGNHCRWCMVFGILFWPVYGACSLFIRLFLSHRLHWYLDNPFERMARRAAGQRVDIPKEEWHRHVGDWW